MLLLASQELLSLLAMLLSASLLGYSCLAWSKLAQICNLWSPPPAARALSPVATGGAVPLCLRVAMCWLACLLGAAGTLAPVGFAALMPAVRGGHGAALAAFSLYLTCSCSAADYCHRLLLPPCLLPSLAGGGGWSCLPPAARHQQSRAGQRRSSSPGMQGARGSSSGK